MSSESVILQKIRLAVGKACPGVRLFRNNVGVLTDKQGNRIRYGLCPGSSDLIGFKRVTVTPDMVGRKVAVFVAVEVKRPDKRYAVSEDQAAFLQVVRESGGVAAVATSENEAVEALE